MALPEENIVIKTGSNSETNPVVKIELLGSKEKSDVE